MGRYDPVLSRLDLIARSGRPVTKKYIDQLVGYETSDDEFPRLALSAANVRLRYIGEDAREAILWFRRKQQ